MAAEYYIALYDASWNKVAVITDYLELAYTKRLSAPGRLMFTLLGSNEAVDDLVINGGVEVYRRDAAQGVDWYIDFQGLYRGQERSYSKSVDKLTAICPGTVSLLDRRVIAWKTGVSNRSKFSALPAETIMRNLVTYNATSSATTGAGRLRTPGSLGITVAASSGAGTTLSWACAYKPLLPELQELAQAGGVDFTLTRGSGAAYTFDTFVGTDRTDTVIFSLALGNMGEPRYSYDQSDEATVCIVAGQGQKTARATVVRTASSYSTSNDIETFQDGRNEDTTAELNSAGDSELEQRRARQRIEFETLQTPATLYGKHYCINGALGDKVTARYLDIVIEQEIYGVDIQYTPQGSLEKIKPLMRDI